MSLRDCGTSSTFASVIEGCCSDERGLFVFEHA
jgi:hypothetical protein